MYTPSFSDINIAMMEDEVLLLYKHLAGKGNYLEFGAGGSTYVALRSVLGRVISIESNEVFIGKLKAEKEISRAISAGRLQFLHKDIGEVGDWGEPRNEERIQHWRSYYSDVWMTLDLKYDFVLVDGRFRVMCALMAAAFESDALVGFHDYFNRIKYSVVEKYFDIIDQAGTLAIMKKRKYINQRAWTADFVNHMYVFD